MTHLLNKGENILMYPEGTWNLTPSKLMLPLYWGVVDLAKVTEAPIIPIVAEYHQKCCYVKFGQPLYMGKRIDKRQGINLGQTHWQLLSGIYGKSFLLKKELINWKRNLMK